MDTLTRPHERALSLVFSELATQASETASVLIGTPGTLATRSNAEGTRFWVRRFSDGSGKRREEYLGKVGDSTATRRTDDVRARIAATNAAIARVRMLARAGYAVVDKKAFFTLASLHNYGVFRAGAFLVGSHAYGALLDTLGVRAVPYATEDVDIARREALALPEVPSFLDMLRATGVDSSPCRSSTDGLRLHPSKSAAHPIFASTSWFRPRVETTRSFRCLN